MGCFINKIANHYDNLKIIGNERLIPMWMILNETLIKNSNDKKISPTISRGLMNSILTGRMYPGPLYNIIITRIRDDKDINYKRAAIIKAYLIRKHKVQENITVSLNENSSSIPYQLGRLFAVVEKAQLEGRNINAIKDQYFISASTTPISAFPVLLKLLQYNMPNGRRKISLKKLKDQILQKINMFPKNLSLDEQGEFILGYYHQTQWFYTRKEEKNE